MTPARFASVVLLGLAIGAGTIADAPRTRPPLMLGGYRVLAADFHLHSSTWSDGTLTPWGLVLEAERQGLDAIAITGHNQLSDGELGRRFSRFAGGPTVLTGEEILGREYHLIAVGIHRRIHASQRVAHAIDEIHRQGGIAIAAHPFSDYSIPYDGAAMQRLDGAEICHPGVFVLKNGQTELEQFSARASVAAIGSSDFHGLGQMGLCRTYVFATDNSERAILEAVRARRTIVFGKDGKAYGHPTLVQYAESLWDRAPSSRSRGSGLDWFSRIAGIMGLAGIVACGRWRPMYRHIAALMGCAVAVASPLFAQTNPTYVQFSPNAVKGALYRPDGGAAPHVAVLLIHRTANFLGSLATRELSQRGFLVLAMNPRSDNNEAAVSFEANALDLKSGVEFLRKQPGIRSIVLWGHSGGGPATSFYEAVAEKGSSYCRGANKLIECDAMLDGLPKADGLILVDAHPGVSVNGLRSLNPAVIDEHDPKKIDPALDPFNPANGYRDGASRYSDAFKQKYFAAQAGRMNRLIDAARAELDRMTTGTAPYPDDDAMVVTRFEGARLMELDASIHHGTLEARKLLKNDGTVVTQRVESVRRAPRGYDRRNASFEGGARIMTLRSFLSANAIRATDSMDGVDWCSSNNSTRCAVRSISIPILITAMGAHYFVRDNEIHFEEAASADTDFIVIEGATHGSAPCTACETTPGQYSNSQRNFFDYVTAWMKARF